MNNALKPKIRFNEFIEDWEKHKFENYGTVSMCKRIFKNETTEKGDIPFYKIGTFGNKADAYISNDKFEYYKSKFSYPNKGDILLSASGTIGRIVEYNGEKAYFQDSNIVWLSHNDNIKNSFLKVLYPTVKWYGIEGSTIKRLYNSNFLNTEFYIPNVEEQEKIGTLFDNIDTYIFLHQNKYDKLLELKKSLSEKMFPQNGSIIPEIRFSNFSNNWSIFKYCNLFDTVESGNRLPKDMIVSGNIPYVLASLTNNGVVGMISEKSRDYHGNKMKLFKMNSITFSIDNPDAIFVQKNPFFTSNIMRVLHNDKYDYNHLKFISTSLKTLTKNYNWSFKFSGPVVMNSSIKVPINNDNDIDLHEIQKIGKLLTYLDDLSELYLKRINKMRAIKQSLLSDMFV